MKDTMIVEIKTPEPVNKIILNKYEHSERLLISFLDSLFGNYNNKSSKID